MKTLDDLKEQLQEDMLTFLDGFDNKVLETVCNIIVDRINDYKKLNP